MRNLMIFFFHEKNTQFCFLCSFHRISAHEMLGGFLFDLTTNPRHLIHCLRLMFDMSVSANLLCRVFISTYAPLPTFCIQQNFIIGV